MSRLALTKQNSITLFQSTKIAQRSKKFAGVGCGAGTSAWEGRAEKESKGVTSYMIFSSPGIYFSTKYTGRDAERMVPKACRAKGGVTCSACLPDPLLDAAPGVGQLSHGNLSFRSSFRGWGIWVFPLVLLLASSSPKASCTWCESSFLHGAHLLWLFGSHSMRCAGESTSMGKDRT